MRRRKTVVVPGNPSIATPPGRDTSRGIGTVASSARAAATVSELAPPMGVDAILERGRPAHRHSRGMYSAASPPGVSGPMDMRAADDAKAGQDGVGRLRVPYTGVHRLVRRLIEPLQDVLVVLLALGLFGVMVRALLALGADVLSHGFSFRSVISEALFVLVLIELQRLLIIYLRDHHVSVDVMIEVTIVGVLREVLLSNPSRSNRADCLRSPRSSSRSGSCCDSAICERMDDADGGAVAGKCRA